MMWYTTSILVVLLMSLSEVSVHAFAGNDVRHEAETVPDLVPYITDNEYTHRIHSMIDAYRGDVGGRMVIETNALIDTKYRMWKRNADLINSILALPKGMNDAGR